MNLGTVSERASYALKATSSMGLDINSRSLIGLMAKQYKLPRSSSAPCFTSVKTRQNSVRANRLEKMTGRELKPQRPYCET